MKRSGYLSAWLLLGSLGVYSATNASNNALNLPSLGDHVSGVVSQQQEYELGQAWLKNLRAQVHTLADPELKDYLEKLIFFLASSSDLTDLRLTPLIIKDRTLNAFAAPGGIVGVNVGLFLNAASEAQFAAVLAHELAHLSQRHFARNMEEAKNQRIPTVAAILASILLAATAGGEAGSAALSTTIAGIQSNQLRFSRDFEREADNLGIVTLSRSGLDPNAMPAIFEKMAHATRYSSRPPEFLLTHPVTESRIASSRARAAQMPPMRQDSTDDVSYQFMRVRALILSSTNLHGLHTQLKKQVGKDKTVVSAAGRYGMAVIDLKLNRTADAAQQLALLQTLFPDNLHLLLLQAQLEAKRGQWQQAVQLIDQQLKLYPDHYALLSLRAAIYTGQKQFTKAISDLTKISRLRPHDPDVWFILAETQGQAGNIARLHQARAEYFFWMGDIEQAIKHLEYAQPLVSKQNATQAKIKQKTIDFRKYQEKLSAM